MVEDGRTIVREEHDDTAKARKVKLVDGTGTEVGTDSNKLEVEASLEVGDIEIGAVEIKDGDSDTRLDVELDSSKNASFVQSESLASESTLSGVATESGGNLDTIAGDTTSLDATALKLVGMGIIEFDYASQAQAATTDTWTLKTGGAGGSTVATITITYTDATKTVISTAVKT